jgi:hypothetical protein
MGVSCHRQHIYKFYHLDSKYILGRDRRGCDRMVVGFTTTYEFSAYHHCREFEFHPWRGVLDTTLCDKVCP